MFRFLSNLFRSGQNQPSRPIRQTFRPELEALEDRIAMSTLNLSGIAGTSALALNYTAGAGVSNHVSVSLNSSNNYVIEDTAETISLTGTTTGITGGGTHSVTVPHDKVANMAFLLGDIGDSFKVLACDHSITVNGGAGSDTFQVGDNGFSMDRIQGKITLNGGGQNASDMDVVNIIDGTTTSQKFWSIQNNLVTRTSTGQISYNDMKRVAIAAGKGDDVIDVISTMAATPVYVSGGDGNDLFRLGSNGSIQNLAGNVQLDGLAGSNWLDYRAFIAPVRVYLDAGLAPGALGGISNFENVFGGTGDDELHGNNQNNILVGNGGNDYLFGNEGRDILIGGLGVDHIYAGSGEDILIGDKSPWDGSASALQKMMDEWARSVTSAFPSRAEIDSATYESRTGRLAGDKTGGLNGSFFINHDNVHDDGAIDFLNGEGDRDWFFATTTNPLQEALDRIITERIR